MRTSLFFASTLAALLAHTAVARAQYAIEPRSEGSFATPPPARPRLRAASEEKPALLGLTAEGGSFYSPELRSGGWGRIGVQALAGPNVHGAGPVYGLWESVEFWGTKGMGGGSMAVTGLVGFKTPSFLATLGGGFNLIAVDKKTNDDRWGVGFFTPRASVRIGLHLDEVFVGVTGDVQRRYAWGRGGATLFQGGLAIGGMFDPLLHRTQARAVVAR